MGLIFDAHVLVWLLADKSRLTRRVNAALAAADGEFFASAVTAREFVELQDRGRLPVDSDFAVLTTAFDVVVLPLPTDLWRFAANLPQIHGDPIDRMLVAHALAASLTLVTADRAMRRYPVATLW